MVDAITTWGVSRCALRKLPLIALWMINRQRWGWWPNAPLTRPLRIRPSRCRGPEQPRRPCSARSDVIGNGA
jgi:hypothetical protein